MSAERLTETERADIAHALWHGAEDGPIAAEGKLAATIERIIATHLAARLAPFEALAENPAAARSGTGEPIAVVLVGDLRAALRADHATPDTDGGA